MKTFRTHYDNLQVSESASPEVIRGAYRYLSQKWHPDKNPDRPEEAARITRLINAAYEALSDPQRRKEHDDWIAARRKAESRKSSPRDAQGRSTDTPAGSSSQAQPTTQRRPSLSMSGAMNHEWAWTASLVPFIVLIAESLLPPVESYWLYTYVSIGAYILCCSLDERHLRKSGFKAPSAFWVLLVPVYLWQRDSLFGRWRPRFWLWCAALVTAAILDSTQYVIGSEISGVWTSEELGRVELVLGTDPKTITLGEDSMRVKFLSTERDHATYEFVSGELTGETVTVRRVWVTDDSFTLDLVFFDDPKETYPLGFVRPN